ncbi:MAG: hypothetical protein JXR25_02515 [Pontiellaceae bacterium]|nr:hypothetical protein [Pontiellaceae bacterium]
MKKLQMRRNMRVVGLAAALVGFVAGTQAATVTLTVGDAVGTSSFNSAGNWSDAAAPSTGNDYTVNLQWLRTPAVGNSNHVFYGDSLTIGTGGGIIFKGWGTSTNVVDDLILSGGGLIRSGAGCTDTLILEGNITVTDTGTIQSDQNAYIINSDLAGAGDLTLSGGYGITLNGTCAMTGDIIVSEGTKTFSTNSLCIFTIGANGVNNAITGSGAVFNGSFEFDLSGASTIIGDSWVVATAGVTYGTNFVIEGFLDNGDGTWYLDGVSGKYKFYEETCTLLSVSGNIVPITYEDMTPTAGRALIDTQPEISILLVDGSDDAIISSSIAMSVAGTSVSPTVSAPSAGTHLVSYTPTSPLAVGPVEVMVTYDADNAVSYTNTWTFIVHPTTTETLWNINIAGNITGTKHPVADGVFVVAPAMGDNMWNNVAGVSGANNQFDIYDANGNNIINYETSGSHAWGENTELVFPDLFLGWCGANAPMNMTNTLSGLNPDNSYDLYVYSTWRWTQNTVEYNIIEGFAHVTYGEITEVQANVQNAATNDYTGCVYGENYIIFENVTPTAEGRIVFTGVCADGILSGLQILEIPGGASIPDIEVGDTLPADGATAVSATPILSAYFNDIAGSVDSGSISMTIDGASVSPSFSYSDPVSTVSYTVVTPFEPSTVHTAKVVVAGSPGGTLFTNEWSFTTAGTVVYVDAEAGTGSNTMEWNGSSWVEFSPPQNTTGGGDNLWEEEWSTTSQFGNGPSTSNSWFEAGREGAEDAPQLRTRVTGLEDGTYQVYAYFWWASGAAQPFYLGTALTNNPAGGLPVYTVATDGVAGTGVSQANASAFTSKVVVTSADRKMYQVSLGSVTVSGGILDVYIDDVGDASNVWYDGIGYEASTGATLEPVIQSIVVSGGTVQLLWTSESGATYSIMKKSSLTGAWSAAKTGISGGESTTSDSVDASGDDQEFFRIEGE